eukprot:6207308-Pleurochrysis_carterae.AAC.1
MTIGNHHAAGAGADTEDGSDMLVSCHTAYHAPLSECLKRIHFERTLRLEALIKVWKESSGKNAKE